MPIYDLYTTRDSTLDEISDRTKENIKREQQGLAKLEAAKKDLDEMAVGSGGNPSPYAGLIEDIDNALSNSPGSALYQAQKDRKNEMVSDFGKVRQRVTMRLAVMDAVDAALAAGWTPAQITSAVETALTTD